MSVRIRLKKMGRTHRPFFRVCAADQRSPRDGKFIEELGTYDPMVPSVDARAILNGERIAYWLSVGATPSRKMATLIKKYGKDGSHLEAQKEAISQLSERRQKSIASAVAAANAVEMPKVEEPKPAEEAEAKPAEGEAAKADGEEKKADAAADAKPADEKKADEKKADDAPAAEEKKADEKPAAEEKKPAAEKAEEKPAEEKPAEEKKAE